MSDSSNVTLASINEQLDTLTFSRVEDDNFILVGHPSNWLYSFFPECKPGASIQLKNIFIFLGDFLEQAAEQFDSGNVSLVRSGPWSERDVENVERNLSALALQVENSFIVQISLIPEEQLYHQRIFQKAREYSLEYERLNKMNDNKEVLMHSIIHDLSGPLTSIGGALTVLSDFDLDKAERNKFKNIVESQIELANDMIKGIFEVFIAEEDSIPNSATVEEISSIYESLNTVIANFSPAFKQQNVTLVLENKLLNNNISVLAEQEQFTRVFINLLENALRYSPIGSQVTARLEETDERLCISIQDEGPGVPEKLVDSLFNRFVGGQKYGGKAGFGLYYCQICIRRWGGEIKYLRPSDNHVNAANEPKGACFEIYLQKA